MDYEIRSSVKARSLRLKMTARGGLTVIAPRGLSERQIVELVAGKRDWIATRLDQFKEARHLLGEASTACPQAFDLPALAESWRIEYRETKARIIGAKTDRPGRLLVYGAVGDSERSKAALRRWVARHAKEALGYWLESLSAETGLRFSRLTIKSQRTRWGSCSTNRVISLNCKLLFLSRDLVRYVLIHELCHTLEHNHSSRFWVHLRQFEPKTDTFHGQMRESWKRIPAWAHPIQIGGEEF
jgi:predicted metal-dependent hydrolase